MKKTDSDKIEEINKIINHGINNLKQSTKSPDPILFLSLALSCLTDAVAKVEGLKKSVKKNLNK